MVGRTSSISAPRPQVLRQAWRFGFVGLSGVAVNLAVLSLLHGLMHWPLSLSVALATELAILNNFIWNGRWTFVGRGTGLVRLVQFNLSSLGGLAIATFATIALVEAGVFYILADLVGIAGGAICNFTASALWIWKT